VANALLLDLATMVKEQKEVGKYWTENIRNVYGLYLDDIRADELDGTVQEILYKILGKYGITKAEADARMELFINEIPYAYFNVAGRDNMKLADGANEVINLCKGKEFVVGLATPMPERISQNMMERTGIDLGTFRFAEYGAFNKDANALLMAAMAKARSIGAEADNDGIFVSASPNLLSAARALGIKTVAITDGNNQKFEGINSDSKIRSLREIRKGLQTIRKG